MRPILLPSTFARQMEREAEGAYPEECCGILFGRDEVENRVVSRIERVANDFAENERRRRFLIAPETLMKAERSAGERGELVLGFYHSHPDAPARPSDFDREHAWPFYSYLIVSVAHGRAVDATSWVLEEETNRFVRQDVQEIDGPPA